MLFLEFCNIREWNTETLLDLYRRYRISHTRNGFERGWELMCVTRQHPGRFFFLTEPPAHWSANRYLEKGTWIQISEARHAELWPALEGSQRAFRLLLDQFSAGELDLGLINEFASRATTISVQFRSTDDRYTLLPDISATYEHIQAAVQWSIAELFLTGKGDILQRIRLCPDCGTYFVSSRPDRKFCTEKCRKHFHNRKAIDSGRFAAYMKTYRDPKTGLPYTHLK